MCFTNQKIHTKAKLKSQRHRLNKTCIIEE